MTINQFKKELLLVSDSRPSYNVYLYTRTASKVLGPRYDFNFYDAEFYNIRDFLHKYLWHLHPDRVKWIHKVNRDRWENLFERDTLGVYSIAFNPINDLEAYHTVIVTQDAFFCPF